MVRLVVGGTEAAVDVVEPSNALDACVRHGGRDGDLLLLPVVHTHRRRDRDGVAVHEQHVAGCHAPDVAQLVSRSHTYEHRSGGLEDWRIGQHAMRLGVFVCTRVRGG